MTELRSFRILSISLILIAGKWPITSEAYPLSHPPKERSYEMVERGIDSIFVENDVIWAIPKVGPFFITGSLTEHSLLGMKRERPSFVADWQKWNGIWRLPRSETLLFDGAELEFYRINENLELMARKSVIWDRLRPLPDRGGEAPQFEINHLRHQFKKNKALLGTGLVISGLAPIKDGFYIALSRVPDFPFLSVNCDTEFRCEIMRVCSYKMRSAFPLHNGSAIAFDGKNVLIPSEDERAILVMRLKGYSLQEVGRLEIPPRLKAPRGVFVDEKRRLWVSTKDADDYENASVFYWEAEEWLKGFP